MATQYKYCRICGKQYEACRSRKPNDTSFHWKEVACSPECGMKYLEAVIEARTPLFVDSEDEIVYVIEEDSFEADEEHVYDSEEDK